MNHNCKSNFAFGLRLVVCLSTSLVTSAQSLPPGKGQQEFKRMCNSCHNVSTATNQRKNAADWTSVVNDMVTRGAQGSPADVENVVAYLSANFGLDKLPAVVAAPTSSTTSQAPGGQSALLGTGAVSKAKEMIKANGCLSCHRVDKAGSYLAPDLSEIGAHRSAEQLRKSITSPNKEVLPENRTVRLVTREGKPVTGKILNQDGLSVQLIDSTTQLRSFQRAELREFTIVDQNPMPSYADKMRAEDLDLLTRYLSSLKEPNIP
jgi:putative heme-binding domain-containing protein